MQGQELIDIYGVWHVPFWQTSAFKAALLIPVCCGLFFLLRVIMRRKRTVMCLTPWEQALQDLYALQKQGMDRPEHAQELYLRLTVILKNYVYQRYNVPVQGKTDSEFVRFLYQKQFCPELIQQVQEIFSGMELIKFAREEVFAEQIKQDILRSIAFIEYTKPGDKA